MKIRGVRGTQFMVRADTIATPTTHQTQRLYVSASIAPRTPTKRQLSSKRRAHFCVQQQQHDQLLVFFLVGFDMAWASSSSSSII